MLRLSLLFLFFPLSLLAQNACDCAARNIALADFQKGQGRLADAYTSMTRGLSFKDTADWTGGDYIKLAEIEDELGKFEDAKAHLLKGIELDGNHEYVRSYSPLKKHVTPEFLPAFEAARGNQKSQMNLDYYSELYQILGADLVWRSRPAAFDTSAVVYTTFRRIDSINLFRLKTLADSLGMPTAKGHGFTSFIPGIVMMHASVTSDSLYHQTLALLDASIARCEFGKSFKAMIIDRYREWVESKPQRFGVWSASSAPPELEDYAHVDSFRFEYNLLSFGDQCKSFGQDPPAAYKPLPYPKNYFCESKK